MLALQAQINPHFIHNTLSVIASIGNRLGDWSISSICSTLSEMLHYAGSFSNEKVILADEIKNLENYFWLMKQR